MTLVPFPPLEPIAEEGAVELKLGKFPNRRFDAPNGGSATVRGFGSLSFGLTLRVPFGPVTDAQIAEVWTAWDFARGEFLPLALPNKFFLHIRAELLNKIPPTIEWHFPKEPPTYESLVPGWSRLDPITFVGQLAERYRG